MPKYKISWEEVNCYKLVVDAKDMDDAWNQYHDYEDIEEIEPHYGERCGETEIEEVDESTPACPISQHLETENT